MNFSFNTKLATIAFFLALLAMIVSLVIPQNRSLDKPKYISVLELAHNIKNRKQIRLIDVRTQQSFEEFHLPTAKHIPLSKMTDTNFEADQEYIFYSGDDSLSIQAWRLGNKLGLKDISVLQGGTYDWYERILYPSIPLQAPPEQIQLAKEIKDLSTFFGGRPRYVEDHHILEYYNRHAAQTSNNRTHKLVLMGC